MFLSSEELSVLPVAFARADEYLSQPWSSTGRQNGGRTYSRSHYHNVLFLPGTDGGRAADETHTEQRQSWLSELGLSCGSWIGMAAWSQGFVFSGR